MNLKWTKGLDVDQTREMKIALVESRLVVERLRNILTDELEHSIIEASRKDNYFMPAWSEYQASKLGEQNNLRKIIQLLEE